MVAKKQLSKRKMAGRKAKAQAKAQFKEESIAAAQASEIRTAELAQRVAVLEAFIRDSQAHASFDFSKAEKTLGEAVVH